MLITNKKILKEKMAEIEMEPNSTPEQMINKLSPFYKKSKEVFIKPGEQTIQFRVASNAKDLPELKSFTNNEEEIIPEILSDFTDAKSFDSYNELQDLIFSLVMKEIVGSSSKDTQYSIYIDTLSTPFHKLSSNQIELLRGFYNDFIRKIGDTNVLEQEIGLELQEMLNDMIKHPEKFPEDPNQPDKKTSAEETEFPDEIYDNTYSPDLTNPPDEVKDSKIRERIKNQKRVKDENSVTAPGDFFVKKKRNGTFVVIQAVPKDGNKKFGWELINITAEVNSGRNTTVDRLFTGLPYNITSVENEQQITRLLRSLEDYLANPEEYVAEDEKDTIGVNLKLRVASYVVGGPIKNKEGQTLAPLPAIDLAEYWYEDCWKQTIKNVKSNTEHLLGNRYMIESYYVERIAKITGDPVKIKDLNDKLVTSTDSTYQKVKSQTFSKILTDEFPGIYGRVKPKLQDFYYKYISKDGTNTSNDPTTDKKLHNRNQVVDGMFISSEYEEGGNKFWFVWSVNFNNTVDTLNLRLKKVYFNNISLPIEKVKEFAKSYGGPYRPKVGDVINGSFWIGEYNPKTHMVENLLREDFKDDDWGTIYSFDEMCELINKNSDDRTKFRKLSVMNNIVHVLGKRDHIDDVIAVKLKDESKKPSLLDYNDMRQFDSFIEYDFFIEEKTIPVIESYFGDNLYIFVKDRQSYVTYKQIVGE